MKSLASQRLYHTQRILEIDESQKSFQRLLNYVSASGEHCDAFVDTTGKTTFMEMLLKINLLFLTLILLRLKTVITQPLLKLDPTTNPSTTFLFEEEGDAPMDVPLATLLAKKGEKK